MTRMTGPDCVVMCNLINTHTHTHCQSVSMNVCMVITYSRIWILLVRIWARETGSSVPFRVSLLILHTQAESGAYSRESSRFPRRRPSIYLNRHTSSGQSQVYWVTQLRTDGVHCRESAGTRPPVVLKLVSVTSVAFASPWTN